MSVRSTTPVRSQTTSTAGTTAPVSLRLQRIDLVNGGEAARRAAHRLARRGAMPDRNVRDAARQILDDVRASGGGAVRAANRRFGGGLLDERLLIERDDLRAAAGRLAPTVRTALETAIANVRRFAEHQRPESRRVTVAPGVELERRWLPLERVGCYVPGGSAAYPSSLVMTVVPARVAGVGAIVVASPADPTGRVDPVLLGAAGLLEVDAVLVAGGAQAIGALAYGLPEIDLLPVARIVGPGNAYVTAAKLEVHGDVGIDMPAGPSEGCVLADGEADPRLVAADLLTQAEHGPDSPAILVTADRSLADAVEAEMADALAVAPRRAILERALAVHGRIVLVNDLDEAVAFVNAYAPEHLSIELRPADLEPAVGRLHSAGSMFVGRWAPKSAGDYATGANHVLPTGGLARSSDPLGVEAYGHYTQNSAHRPRGPVRSAAGDHDAGHGRGAGCPPSRRRGPVRGGGRAMRMRVAAVARP